MLGASLPCDEASRCQALKDLGVLDSAPEAEFDALVAAAALICQVPIALVSLIDEKRQWFKANIGLAGTLETPRDVAFCAHTINEDGMLEVPDALADPRFADNPLVVSAPHIRFYAGSTLQLSDGARVGTLCVIDHVPRVLTDMQREALRYLSVAAARALESRRFAQAFWASEIRFHTLCAAAPVGVFSTDAKGAYTYTNARWQAIYGLTEFEAIGKDWCHAIHTDDKAVALAEGQITGYIGAVEDVTEQVLNRQALQQSVERLSLATDSGGIGVWEWNLLTHEVIWDDQMYALYGRTNSGTLSQYEFWASHLHPEDRDQAEKQVSGALLRGEDHQSEYRIIWADGSVHYLRGSGRILRNANGQPLRMVGVNWDVTALRQLSLELAQQHELLRVTLQSIGDAVITTDAQSVVTWLNPVAERMTGWLSSEAAGQALHDVFRIVDAQTLRTTGGTGTDRSQQDRIGPYPGFAVLITRRGEQFDIEESTAPIRAPPWWRPWLRSGFP